MNLGHCKTSYSYGHFDGPMNLIFSDPHGYCEQNENYDIRVMNFVDVSICPLSLIYMLGKEEAEVEPTMTIGVLRATISLT